MEITPCCLHPQAATRHWLAPSLTESAQQAAAISALKVISELAGRVGTWNGCR